MQTFDPSLLSGPSPELTSLSLPDRRSNQLSYRGTDTTGAVKQEIYLAGKDDVTSCMINFREVL